MIQNLLYRALPLTLLLLPYVLHATLEDAGFFFNKESGLLENITVILLAIAIFITLKGFQTVATSDWAQPLKKTSQAWLILYCLGCIYFLGEEISWGQHLFDWATPDSWADINDQNETNLHNTYAIFDQIPRAIMTLGIVVFGFFYPIFSNQKQPQTSQGQLAPHFFPGKACVITAATILFISVHDKIYGLFGTSVPEIIDIGDGEVKECLIALFILVYIVELSDRWRTARYDSANDTKANVETI